MLLWMLLVGWIVLLPAIVVGGLYVSSSVLGRRRAALHAYDDLFVDETSWDEGRSEVTPEQAAVVPISGHQFVPARDARPSAPADATAADRPSVAARY